MFYQLLIEIIINENNTKTLLYFTINFVIHC